MSDRQQSQLSLSDGTMVSFVLSEEVELTSNRMDPAVPVARPGRKIATLAAEALRTTLQPLGMLLQEVHDAVSATPAPPSEITVAFGVQVGQDLKLGVVNGSGQAHLTVTAKWSPDKADGGAGGSQP